MDKIYGEVFKNLRLNKGFSIKEIACGYVSSSTISKFENGHSNISIDKFFVLLKNINMSPQEYFTYLEEMIGTSHSISILNLPLAFDHKNYVAIEHLLFEFSKASKTFPDNYALKLQVISIKSLIHQINRNYVVDQKDINLIRQYLLSSKTWNEFELQLYSRSTSLFDPESLRILTKRMFDPFNYTVMTYSVRLYIYNALVNLTNTLVERKDYTALQRVERFVLSNPVPERYMFQKAVLQFNFEIGHFYLVEDKNEVSNKLLAIISTFETLGCLSWATRLKEILASLNIF